MPGLGLCLLLKPHEHPVDGVEGGGVVGLHREEGMFQILVGVIDQMADLPGLFQRLVQRQAVVVEKVAPAGGQKHRRQVVDDLRMLGIHVLEEDLVGALIAVDLLRQHPAAGVAAVGVEHAAVQPQRLEAHPAGLVADGLLQPFRTLHGGHIERQVGPRALRRQEHAVEVNVIVHQAPPHKVEARAHVVQLFADVCPGGQTVFDGEYQIVPVRQQAAEVARDAAVAEGQPAAVDGDDDGQLGFGRKFGLEDVHGQRHLVPVDVGDVERLLHVVIVHGLRAFGTGVHIRDVHALRALEHGADHLALNGFCDSSYFCHETLPLCSLIPGSFRCSPPPGQARRLPFSPPARRSSAATR